MLVGVFPVPLEAKARVVKFVDRYWIEADGQVEVVRRLVIQLAAESPAPLAGVQLVVPLPEITSLEDWSADHGMDPGWYYNQVFTTRIVGGEFKVIEPIKGNNPGVVSFDGIGDIHTYPKAGEHDLFAVFRQRTTFVTYRFRGGRLLNPGESVQIIIKFRTKSVLQSLTSEAAQWQLFRIGLSYFDTDSPDVREALKESDGSKFMEFSSFYDSVRLPEVDVPIFTGGFDIFAYLPPQVYPDRDTFTRHIYRQEADYRLSDGTYGVAPREKLIFRLREEGFPKVFYPGNVPPLIIRGIIRPEMFSAFEQIRQDLQDTVKDIGETSVSLRALSRDFSTTVQGIKSLSEETQRVAQGMTRLLESAPMAIKLAYLSIAVSLCGVVATLVIFIFDRYLSK